MCIKFRRQQVATLAAVLLSAVVPAGATIIIDPFTTSQLLNAPARPPASIANQGATLTSTALNNAPLALGGQRELYYRALYGTSAGSINTNNDNFEAAAFRTGTNGVANGLFVYDGATSTTALGASGAVTVPNATNFADAANKVKQFRFGAPDAFGLGGVDLTEGNTNDRIRIGAYADNQGVQLVLRFFVNATNYAEAILNIPGSASFQYNPYEVKFSDFTAVGLNGPGQSIMDAFTGVNAITLQLNGETSTDATFDFFAATNAIPEPGTYSLLGIGLVGFGALRRRIKS